MTAARPPRSGRRPPGSLARIALAAFVLLALGTSYGCATYSNGTAEAKELLNAGLAAYDVGDNDVAAEKMELALKQDPLYSMAMAHLGMVYHRRGQSDRGIQEIKQALKLNENLAEGYDNLGEIYFDLKRYDEAEKMFIEAATTFPGTDDAHFSPNFNLGRLYAATNRDDKALESFIVATKNNPKHVRAHVAAGMLYLKNGVKKDAEQHFKLALEYDKSNPVANYGLAKIALDKDQFEEAILRLREALQVIPDNPDFLKLLKEAYRRSPPRVAISLVKLASALLDDTKDKEPKTKEALEILDAAEKIDGKNVEVYVQQARAYLDAKPRRIEEGEKAAKKGYAVDPKNPRIRYYLALARIGGAAGLRTPEEKDKLRGAEDLLRGLRREYPTKRTAPPGSLDIRRYLGVVFFKQKQYRRAEIEWREGLKISPEDANLKKNIEQIWATPGVQKSNQLNDKGLQALAAGNLDEAKDLFRGAVELDDQFAVAHSNLALLGYQVGDMVEARRRAKMAIERDPDLGKAHLYLGMVDEKENKLDAAMKSYVEAADLTREVDPEPHYAIGCLLMKRKKMREAEDAFLLALEIHPDHCRSNYQLGLLYAAKGLIDKAEARWKIAMRSCPEFPLPLVELARLFIKQKRYKDAQEILEKAFQLDTTAPEPFMGLAEVMKAQGEKDKACGSYLEAAARFTARSQYEDAVRACREALASAPHDPKTPAEKQLLIQSHNDLGVALMNTGAFTEALDELKKADDLEPENLIHRFNMGLCYAKKGDKERAAETYRALLKLNPPIAYRVMELLADLYVIGAKDNPLTLDEAIDLLRKALKLEPDEERKAMVRRRIEELEKERKKNK